jgi:iron(III) transport system permease protein
VRLSGARAGRAGAVAAGAAALVPLVLLPLARLVQVAATGGGQLARVLTSASFAGAVRNTVVLAVAVTAAAVPLGLALALLLRHPGLPGRGGWRTAVLLPLLVPDFVLGYGWTQAYGPGGFTDGLLGRTWSAVPGPVQVWLVLVVGAVPVAYLVLAAGLAARAEPQRELAARASGAGPVTALRTVTLPLLGPAVAAAAVLVFALALGAFAVPQVLGTPAGFRTVTTQIYADLSYAAEPAAFVEAVALALVLVVLALLLVAPADAVLAPRLRAPRTAAAAGPPPRPPGRRAAVAAETALGGYLLVTLVLPLAALVLAAVTRAAGLPPTPANWSLANLRAVLTPRTFEALGRSAALAGTAATVLVLLGGAVVLLERRGGRAVPALLTATFVLPGSTLAVGLLVTYGRWITAGTTLILLAYLAKFWALAQRPLSGAADRLPVAEWHAARGSGAGPLAAARTVVLPAMAPALLAGWLLCLLTALHEVTVSSLLYGPGGETFAVVVLDSEDLGLVGPTAALAVLLTVLVAVPALLLGLVARRRRLRPAARPVVPGVPVVSRAR